MTKEEAIEIIKSQYPHDHVMKTALGLLIPELRESEDERIRKKCIELIKRVIPSGDNHSQESKEILDCISYLEKQKELDKMIVVSPEVWDNAISDAFENGKKEGEKQKEQKPWSEEDENAMKYLHELISFGFVEKFFDAQTAADMRKWLNTRFKSLRPQPHWKPSEEQMRALNEIICLGEISYVGQEKELIALRNKLKRLM